MVLVDHTQTSEGFTGGFPVGIRETKSSGGDEPGIHIRVAGALFPRKSLRRTEECSWSRTPSRRTLVGPPLQCVPG